MRKMLILTAIVSMAFVSTQEVEAGRRNRSYTRSRDSWRSQSAPRDGVFARLIELERRKNTFLFGRPTLIPR
jgi:hypothetical protein